MAHRIIIVLVHLRSDADHAGCDDDEGLVAGAVGPWDTKRSGERRGR